MKELRNKEYVQIPNLRKMIISEFENSKTDFSKSAALYLATLLQLWFDKEIIEGMNSLPYSIMIMGNGDLSNFLKDCGFDNSTFDKPLAS